MKKAILITAGVVAIGAIGVYLYKRRKTPGAIQSLTKDIGSLLQFPSASTPKGGDPAIPAASATYTASEATKKALDTVTAWIKLFDEIPAAQLAKLNKRTKLLPFANPRTPQEGAINLLAINFNALLKDKTLGAYKTRAKNTLYQQHYATLVQLYKTLAKDKVDRLVSIYPRYIFTNPDFDYFTQYAAENPLSIEEKLFLANEIQPVIAGIQS